MYRLIPLPLILILSSSLYSQVPGYFNDTLYTQSGFKVTKKQTLKIGVGSMPDGDFKFIRRNIASIFNYSSQNGYQGLANQANSLPRNFSGHTVDVFRIDRRGNKKFGYTYYPVMSLGLMRFEIDIDNAIASGEIVVPDEFKPKNKNAFVIKSDLSLADELAKLKKLYADSTLTKEEYEAAKKKLLEKQ